MLLSLISQVDLIDIRGWPFPPFEDRSCSTSLCTFLVYFWLVFPCLQEAFLPFPAPHHKCWCFPGVCVCPVLSLHTLLAGQLHTFSWHHYHIGITTVPKLTYSNSDLSPRQQNWNIPTASWHIPWCLQVLEFLTELFSLLFGTGNFTIILNALGISTIDLVTQAWNRWTSFLVSLVTSNWIATSWFGPLKYFLNSVPSFSFMLPLPFVLKWAFQCICRFLEEKGVWYIYIRIPSLIHSTKMYSDI